MVGRVCRSVLGFASTEILPSELGGSAVIFSPHPDDESLGCGGTIIKKRTVGAPVKLVHMTDGAAATHGNLISGEELRKIRMAEALNASRVLGLSDGDTYFLEFEDGRLAANSVRATQYVMDILRKERPEEVFVPYRREPIFHASDHLATTNIVLTALRRLHITMVVWEYPVWFWLHWPWVRLWQGRAPIVSAPMVLRNSLRSFLGLRAFIDLRHSVDISAVVGLKQAAISQHKSQLEQLIQNPQWVRLQDIARGEFLQCFTGDREFFRRSD